MSLWSQYICSIFSANEENESILKINAFLEGAVKEGKISERLYGHLKGTKSDFAMHTLYMYEMLQRHCLRLLWKVLKKIKIIFPKPIFELTPL